VKGEALAAAKPASKLPAPAASAFVQRAPSSDAKIEALESKLQYRLPPSLYAYFRSTLHSGTAEIRRDPSLDAPLYEFLDARSALQNWNVMIGIDDWDRAWVPIAHDGAGNLHFVHATKGMVGFACHDPYGRKHGKLTLEGWLAALGIEWETFARKAAPLPPPKPPKKARPGTVTSAWAALEKWLDANDRGPAFKRSLNPGASDAAIDAAAERLDWNFPDDLRDFYRRHDGQNARKAAFTSDQGVKVLPLERLTSARPPQVPESCLIIGGGKGSYDRPWLLTFDKQTGAIELYAPDTKYNRHIKLANSIQAWLEELVAGLGKRRVSLMSDNSFKYWNR
jgi:cell wall assembly regulator SMI1